MSNVAANEPTEKTTVPPKIWKRMGIYNTYEDASVVRNQLLVDSPDGSLAKIKRCGPAGINFQVKLWVPAKLKKNKKTR